MPCSQISVSSEEHHLLSVVLNTSRLKFENLHKKLIWTYQRIWSLMGWLINRIKIKFSTHKHSPKRDWELSWSLPSIPNYNTTVPCLPKWWQTNNASKKMRIRHKPLSQRFSAMLWCIVMNHVSNAWHAGNPRLFLQKCPLTLKSHSP